MLKIAIAEDETSAQTALKEYLDRWQAENGQPVQKVQLCFRDMAERETARAEIA